MKTEISFTDEPLDLLALTAKTCSPTAGAAIQFLGIVRQEEAGAPITALNYEAYEPMALYQFQLILDQIRTRWPIESIRLIHRLGRVAVAEPSLWVEVTSPHRAEAFAACQFLIDEMKKIVPIWKHPVQN